jgi:hypothetical protein
MTTIEIRASALNLPAPERAALAHDLIASLDAEAADPCADALWPPKLSAERAMWRTARPP